jgi:hypothetical protein
MTKPVKFQAMLGRVRQGFERMPDFRPGQNTQYELVDAGLSAFSVFHMQEPSFLAYQQHMQEREGRNNAKSLYGIEDIPSDGQIRNLLDPLDPSYLREPFWEIYNLVKDSGHLDDFRSVGETLLCSMDGTRYFTSDTIHCPNCTVYEHEKGASYAHMVVLAVLSAPEQQQVIALEPEFITPQDGHDKQDCEQQAIKRWVRRNAQRFEPWQVTVLTDDLHSHQPLCETLLANKLHFLMTCKPDSHPALYEEIGLLTKVDGAIQTLTVQRWTGRRHEVSTYRWVTQVPLRAGANALRVNWLELTVVQEESGKQLYHNAWITDHVLTAQTVEETAAAGRSRWHIENQGINVLKNQGYNFEHNYGHGNQHLSAVLLSLLLLAFLVHTVLDLTCSMVHAIRSALGARRNFFADLRALTRYLYFPSWDDMISFMFQKPELSSG